MYTLLNANVEAFIPFFAIFFTFSIPILAIYFYNQQRKRVMEERKLMIEKGITPPPMKESVERFGQKSPMTKGLNMIAIALGLLVGYFISTHYHIRGPFAILGSVLFFLGITNVLSGFLDQKNNTNSNPNIDHE